MVAENLKPPHVALLCCPGMGHLIPFMEFAKLLVQNHGITVSFLVITTDASPAQIEFFKCPKIPPEIQIIEIPPADMSNVVSEVTPLVARLCLTVRESLKPINSILAGLNLTALVLDMFTTQAIDVARQLSIPVYCFCTVSASFLAFSLYVPTFDRELEGEYMDRSEPVKVPGGREERVQDLMDPARNRKSDDYKWCLFHFRRLTLVDGILENSWEDLERLSLDAMRNHDFYKTISAPPVYPIGPIIKPPESIFCPGDAKIISWLDDQPPDSVLFVAFGSGGTLTSAQLTELAWGLEMSEQRFILVARKPFDALASAAYFRTKDDANNPLFYLPEGFLERTEKVGLTIPSWGPQAAILGHPSTGAFLSHCGWNSALESLSRGVPILAWPLYAEQRMNATLLVEEVGAALKPDVVVQPGKGNLIGRKEVEKVVRAIMRGEEGNAVRRKAKLLKESAEKAMKSGGSSFDSVSRVVDFWKSQ
ncbi:OLC1v1017900C1 [Oldenlandia corymbosa var. corymbosa]|uniref:Glycosyltransferase n=1 Tax=Oldenlandia corymbosa var. corymbosa TaxID=529605 RepID=A0AAV1EAG4_OLDCO|nr:OLC1v1017900C1 [Oldenlandia corymbosa var. corymbosa]